MHTERIYSDTGDGRLVARPVPGIVDRILRRESRGVRFMDADVAAKRRYAAELFGTLRGAGVVWVGSAALEVAGDEALLDVFAESGCCLLSVRMELFGRRRADNLYLSRARRGLYERYVRRIRRRGIMVHGRFMFGGEAGDGESLDEAVDWAMRCRLDAATFHILGRRRGGGGRSGRLSARDVSAGIRRASARYNSWHAILERAAADPWARVARLMLNAECGAMGRQGAAFGEPDFACFSSDVFLASLRLHRYGEGRMIPEVIGGASKRGVA